MKREYVPESEDEIIPNKIYYMRGTENRVVFIKSENGDLKKRPVGCFRGYKP